MEFNLEYIEKLAELVRRSGLEEITVENEDKMISLRRASAVFSAQPPVLQHSAPQITSQVIKPETEKQKKEDKGRPVKSPMAGTFYAAPSPDNPPFVKIGDAVSAGQTVCIIEAMKLMNEIETEISGKISEICVKDGESVDAGSVLMYVQS